MKKTLVIALIIGMASIGCYCYLPTKIAVKYESITPGEKYIIVEHQYTTAGVWQAVGDESGMYDEPVDVKLTGNYPDAGYYVQNGNNQYICYADYKGEEFVAAYKNKVYYVNEWDILYPIKREDIIPLPQLYLTPMDFR